MSFELKLSIVVMLLLLFELFLAIVLSSIFHAVFIILFVYALPFGFELDTEELGKAVNVIAFNNF